MQKIVIDTNVIVSALIGSGHCKFLITGNTNDFTFNEFGAIKIITPEAFINTFLRI